MADNIQSFIAAMPKAELHVHLEGCITPQLTARLASRNRIELPPPVAKASTDEGFAFHDLTSFLKVYYPAMHVLQTALDFEDLAMDYLEIAHAQNVVHCELFFDPQAHTSRGVPFPDVIRGFSSAALRAQRKFDMSVSLIMCFLRDMDAGYAMATLMEALPYKDSIVGVGLDSDERGNPPIKFKEVFERARKEGFMLTMHCDVDQEGSIDNIRQAVEVIQVDRIDHGTNVVEDEGLVDVVRDRGIGLTSCLISNSVVTKGFKGKETLDLLRGGVNITVNSDDPAYFRGYVNENLVKLATETDVTKQELIRLQENAFKISWLPTWRKDEFLKQLRTYAKEQGLSN